MKRSDSLGGVKRGRAADDHRLDGRIGQHGLIGRRGPGPAGPRSGLGQIGMRVPDRAHREIIGQRGQRGQMDRARHQPRSDNPHAQRTVVF